MMFAAHFISKIDENMSVLKMPIYESGYWDLKPDEAECLKGGRAYFHQTKQDSSYIGGKVLDWRKEETDAAHSERIVFTFEADFDGRGKPWRGRDHSMAWWSGLVSD
ncbi:hypothetical protein ACFPOD_14810 [Nitratireductor kimnyeongensis]|uniref:Uncharacterized protein n=1 Tax=Nitratireductor kimnyeongensis TaxID=430679 RepID=A0ABW0TAT3_9HYPH|nr:hypothetical protein [Nitratireductor kimnyeongensis]QZZ36673.1 hypothetical protein KW403_05950 [Nitratireductor kimnyeongensis]